MDYSYRTFPGWAGFIAPLQQLLLPLNGLIVKRNMSDARSYDMSRLVPQRDLPTKQMTYFNGSLLGKTVSMHLDSFYFVHGFRQHITLTA